MTLAPGSPPAAAMVARRWAGSGLRLGKLSPPPIAEKRCATPRALRSERAGGFGLVGADGQPPAIGLGFLERVGNAGEQDGLVGGVGCIVGEEGGEIGFLGLALTGGHRPADEHAGAVTNEAGDLGGRERLEPMGCHQAIEAGAEVGQRVDEGAVEVEHERAARGRADGVALRYEDCF